MTNGNSNNAARAYAEQACYQDQNIPIAEAGFRAGWKAVRTHLAAQEPTDAEVLAALNAHGVVMSPKMHPAPSLDYWGDKSAEAMRAALSAARAARRDEATR